MIPKNRKEEISLNVVEAQNNLSDNLPAFLKESDNNGLLDFNQNDVKLSHLKLSQDLSEEVKNGLCKSGEYVDSVMKTLYGDTLDIIVIKHEKVWLQFNKKAFIAKSIDGKTWSTGELLNEEEQWKNLNHVFYVLIKDDLQQFPMALTFGGTSTKTGKELLNFLVRFGKVNREPIFSRTYKLGAKKVNDAGNEYFEKTIHLNPGWVTQDEYQFAKRVVNNIKNTKMNYEEDFNKTPEEEEEDIKLD